MIGTPRPWEHVPALGENEGWDAIVGADRETVIANADREDAALIVRSVNAGTASVVCTAGSPYVVLPEPLVDLALSGDWVYWHDHSTWGGDIVCTGPFTLHARYPVARNAAT